jgi:hypothetical protein
MKNYKRENTYMPDTVNAECTMPSQEDLETAAYYIWEKRVACHTPGDELDDWDSALRQFGEK